MKNYFKSLFGHPVISEVMGNIVNISKPEKQKITLKEIHGEFLNAGNILLEEAYKILAAPKISDSEIYRNLANLGFNNTPQYKNIIQEESNQIKARSVSEKITYYAKHYPKNKFITYDKLIEICSKYGLIFGQADKFIGEIPIENARQIAEFVYNPNDAPVLSRGLYTNRLVESGHTEFHMIRKPIAQYTDEVDAIDGYMKYFSTQDRYTAEYKKLPLFIVANQEMFDMKDMEVVNHELVKFELPKDPIVLKKVIGGYLIITVWGDEENIEEIQL